MLSLFNTGYGLQDQLDGVKNGIAIVSTGNTHIAITSGQYVYIQDHGTLAEGMYKATSNIAANATLSGSNVTAVSGGGLNALNSKFTPIRQDITFSNIHENVTISNAYKKAYISGNVVKCYILITVTNTGVPNWTGLFKITNSNMNMAFSDGEQWFECESKRLYINSSNMVCTGGNNYTAGEYALSFTYLREA